MAMMVPSSALLLVVVCLAFAAFALATDMSIIAYDEAHGVKGVLRSEAEIRNLYEGWLVKHGKAYNALGEKDQRYEIFKDNLRFIDEHNAGDHGFKLGLNRFADLTNEEFRAKFLGAKMGGRKRVESNRYRGDVAGELPDNVDWRALGAVAPVKDQGGCG